MNTLQKIVFGAGGAVLAVFALGAVPYQQNACCSGMSTKTAAGLEKAKVVKGIQKATVTINGGYSPSAIEVKMGQPVELTFKRTEKSGCGGEVVIKDLKFDKTVETGRSVVVKFTPKKAGDIPFTCGMGMLHGKIVVKEGK